MGKASKITSLISTHAKWQNLGHPNGEKVCLRREKKGQKAFGKIAKIFKNILLEKFIAISFLKYDFEGEKK